MMDDATATEELRTLNLEIGLKETEGDKVFFRHLLHEHFVFQRANGAVDDKKWFLEKLQKGPARETRVADVFLHGNRAIVTATVMMNVDGAARSFHNIRLFLREPGAPWRLFAWANERMPD